MGTRQPPLWLVASLACVANACSSGGGGSIPDPEFESDSAGLGTTGMGVVTGPGDGADETGGGGPIVADHCLFDPIDGLHGYKYQCQGNIAIDVVIEGPFDGSPVTDFLQLDFGYGVGGDSYDEPHVMACCPAYDDSAPSCGQPHERACVIDLVEQGCKSIVTNLEDFAYDEFGKPADLSKRNAVLKIAAYVRGHQPDCMNAFRGDTGIAGASPTCDMEGNGLQFDSMLESGEWSFDPDGLVSNVQISVQAANWTGLHPLLGSPDLCASADENDGVLFLELDPAPESRVLRLVAGSAAIDGSWLAGGRVEGVSELSPQTSRLAILIDPATDTATLENLELHSAGAAEVDAVDTTWIVSRFQVRLWDRTVAHHTAGVATVPAGNARFAVSATALGGTGVVTATNATPIVITKHGAGWSTSGFAIVPQHSGEEWSLVIMPAQWQ